MSEKMMKKSKMQIAAMLGTVLIAALTMWGCGTKGYDAPVPSPPAAALVTVSNNALVTASELKGWIDSGLVNNSSGQKVVILDVTTRAEYDKEHIPGAVFADQGVDTNQNRLEGIVTTGSMVPDGARMDKLIQRAGIDQNTTIVFTTSKANPIIRATRGYFAFRYWGFPKERLKVLDGRNKTFAAVGSLTSSEPVVKASTYGVAPNGVNSVRADLRTSLGEMISVVGSNGSNVAIFDIRGGATGLYPNQTYPNSASYNGTNASTDLIDGTKNLVFEGHIKGAKSLAYAELTDPNPANNDIFKSRSDLITLFQTKNSTAYSDLSTLPTTYAGCVSGTQSTTVFFVMDAILGWPVQVYDGSWGQWGVMSNSLANGGKLPAGSVWATDTAALSEPFPILYNVGKTAGTPPAALTTANIILPILDAYSLATFKLTSDFFVNGNQIETVDKAYLSPVPSIAPASPNVKGNSGGC